jgi:hypothetical protein
VVDEEVWLDVRAVADRDLAALSLAVQRAVQGGHT